MLTVDGRTGSAPGETGPFADAPRPIDNRRRWPMLRLSQADTRAAFLSGNHQHTGAPGAPPATFNGGGEIMDPSRFDRWTRAVAVTGTRRSTLRALAALGGAALAGRTLAAPATGGGHRLRRLRLPVQR